MYRHSVYRFTPTIQYGECRLGQILFEAELITKN